MRFDMRSKSVKINDHSTLALPPPIMDNCLITGAVFARMEYARIRAYKLRHVVHRNAGPRIVRAVSFFCFGSVFAKNM